MPHYNAFASFKTKKSVDKKNRAKEKSLGKKVIYDAKFLIKDSDDFGVVVEVIYDEAYVLYENEIVIATLRKDINNVCNKVLFPGDRVVLDDKFVIQNLVKRNSTLSRVKKDSTRLDDMGLTQIIAVNIDLAVIVVSAYEPPLHPRFIDRYLMIIQNSGIEVVVCLNKCDLKTKNEDKILDIYRNLGIPVVETSTINNTGMEELESHLRSKQAIFVGNSGVGKSSLINRLMQDEGIKTSHISEKSKRGRHTTTTSKYYIWDDYSSVIDTPGIRSLDISSFEAIEIQNYFPEFDNWKSQCKYNDCLHYNEPVEDCLVQQGVNNGLINSDRYGSYIRLIEDISGEKQTNPIDSERILKRWIR